MENMLKQRLHSCFHEIIREIISVILRDARLFSEKKSTRFDFGEKYLQKR